MFEWTFEFDAPTVVIFLSAIGVLLLQLLLCFKAKQTFVKLLPIVLLVISTIVFYIFAVSVNGWDGLGYLFFAVLSFVLIFVCGIGWGIWAMVRKSN